MLRLAFSASATRELPLGRQIDLVRRTGYVGICLVSHPRFAPLDALRITQERRQLRADLDAASLGLTAVADDANLLESDASTRRRNMDASALGSTWQPTWPVWKPRHRG